MSYWLLFLSAVFMDQILYWIRDDPRVGLLIPPTQQHNHWDIPPHGHPNHSLVPSYNPIRTDV
jgi:hypothetical protein